MCVCVCVLGGASPRSPMEELMEEGKGEEKVGKERKGMGGGGGGRDGLE